MTYLKSIGETPRGEVVDLKILTSRDKKGYLYELYNSKTNSFISRAYYHIPQEPWLTKHCVKDFLIDLGHLKDDRDPISPF